MATLIDIINDVLRELKKTANKTAISESDMTATIRMYLNEALQNLYELEPFESDLDGTVTITPSTRTFSGPAGIDLDKIYKWSYRINQSGGDIPVEWVTEEYVIESFPAFETEEAPTLKHVYYTNGLIGVYPLLLTGSSNLTLQFKYSAQFQGISSAAATFPFVEYSNETLYCRAFAQYRYEVIHALGQPDLTMYRANKYLNKLTARYKKQRRSGFVGPRFG